jgi:hypothetical protein
VTSPTTAGKAALAGLLERAAARKMGEATADLERLATSPAGRAAGIVARIARAPDPADAACSELARLLALELELDGGGS